MGWSADGKSLLYISGGGATGNDLFVLRNREIASPFRS
jgi:hypothetical protein